MLKGNILNVVMLSVIMPSTVMLSVVIMNVITLNVVMLNVVGPTTATHVYTTTTIIIKTLFSLFLFFLKFLASFHGTWVSDLLV